LAVIGVYMSENKAFELYPIHKSIGVLTFAFIVARIYWRFINGWLKKLNSTNYPYLCKGLAELKSYSFWIEFYYGVCFIIKMYEC
jgi:cytochrome b561